MIKNKKKIITTLGATGIVAGASVAAVAQSCRPTPSNPVEDYYNNTIFTQTDGFLSEVGLQNFWSLYIDANNNEANPQPNIVSITSNTVLLSNVTLDFRITNVRNVSQNIYDFTVVFGSVTANVLGSSSRITFTSEVENTPLFALSMFNFNLDNPDAGTQNILVQEIADDFYINRIIATGLFDFYNTPDTDYFNLITAITRSTGFAVDGSTDEAERARFEVSRLQFAVLPTFDEDSIVATTLQEGSVSVEISTGVITYEYENFDGATSPDSGPLVYSFDYSFNPTIPLAGSATGAFDFIITGE